MTTNDQPKYHIEILKDEFNRRRGVNRNYSLRAYAKFLDIDSGSLSAILNSTRPIPISKIKIFSLKLKLSPEQKLQFIDSILDGKCKK